MNKPDWSKAPEWANFYAVDENGDAYWYEKKPLILVRTWVSWAHDLFKLAETTMTTWRDTLQERPEDKP